MTLEEIENGFTLGKDTDFTHMVIFKDVLTDGFFYFYATNTDEVDKYVTKFTEVDTFRLVGILNYALSFNKQVGNLNLNGIKTLTLK